MNSFREHTGFLTECSLNSFSGVGNQEVLPWFIRSSGITLTDDHQSYVFSLVTDILTEIVRVSTITINSAIFRKIKVHVLHAINIMITSRKNCKLNWHSINCGNNLNGKTIKIFSHRWLIALILFSLDKSGTTDAYIFTSCNWETIDRILK